jgi:hypothetical protein
MVPLVFFLLKRSTAQRAGRVAAAAETSMREHPGHRAHYSCIWNRKPVKNGAPAPGALSAI